MKGPLGVLVGFKLRVQGLQRLELIGRALGLYSGGFWW